MPDGPAIATAVVPASGRSRRRMLASSASRPTKGSSTKLLSSGDAGVGATSECSSCCSRSAAAGEGSTPSSSASLRR